MCACAYVHAYVTANMLHIQMQCKWFDKYELHAYMLHHPIIQFMYAQICIYIYLVCVQYVCDLRPVHRNMWLCLHDLFAFVESTCVFFLLQPIATYNWLITC